MKKVKLFYLTHCPYCVQARKVIGDLIASNQEYAEIEIEWIEESIHPDIADQYDYYYVPTVFINESKAYEAHPGEQYEECYDKIKTVFDSLLKE